MKVKMLDEFKSFAFKGNMIDLAVGVVIGGAFGKVVSSLVADVMMPLIAKIMSMLNLSNDYKSWVVPGTEIKTGLFLGSLIDFLIVALVVFLIVVKLVGAMVKKAAPAPAASMPTSKECPRCLMTIPIKASKCGHCTSDVI